MERYVVSRPLAEKLRDAGYPQTTQFYWYWGTGGWHLENRERMTLSSDMVCSASITDELMEELPNKINGRYVEVIMHETFGLNFVRLATAYLSKSESLKRYIESYEPEWDDDTDSRSRPDALAELYLWCVENGYVKGESPYLNTSSVPDAGEDQ